MSTASVSLFFIFYLTVIYHHVQIFVCVLGESVAVCTACVHFNGDEAGHNGAL